MIPAGSEPRRTRAPAGAAQPVILSIAIVGQRCFPRHAAPERIGVWPRPSAKTAGFVESLPDRHGQRKGLGGLLHLSPPIPTNGTP
jgi:hypothetical protein